jgi:hypothetical protein
MQKNICEGKQWLNEHNKHQNTISYNILMIYIAQYNNVRTNYITIKPLSGTYI